MEREQIDAGRLADLVASVRRHFVDEFAQRVKPPRSANLDALAAFVAGKVGEDGIPSPDVLRSAAIQLFGAGKGWPSPDRFASALAAAVAGVEVRRVARPTDWRWRPHRGGKDPRPQSVSLAEWLAAHERQEAAAIGFLRTDLEANSQAQIAHNEGWLVGLADFVVEHGRLPGLAEKAAIIRRTAALREDLAALTEGGIGLSVPVSSLQALHRTMIDYWRSKVLA